MKISLNWLRDFIELKTTDPEKIRDVLTFHSAEVESVEENGEHLDNIVVGQVEKLMSHPNANALQLAMVNDGERVLKVVCGGSNLHEGMKVAFAKVGAVVRWHGGEIVKIEKTKIRGEESSGMICAGDEIGLAEMFPKQAEKEIVNLSHSSAPVGTPLKKALHLDDIVLDISNTAITQRADLFSHRGMAREFVANGLGEWKKSTPRTDAKPAVSKAEPSCVSTTTPPVEMNIESGCSHYLAVHLTGIEVAESPEWMKSRLSAVGIRPISNIVDITNYVMMELGMPTHAYDLDQVKGRNWTIRKGKESEKVITLDQKKIDVTAEALVIHDGHELIDLCGIMGGYQSGINSKTNKIWLHAPVYEPKAIRFSSKASGQISQAGVIYEKGIDNHLAYDGLKRCTELILELCPGAKVASQIVDLKNYEEKEAKITLRGSQLEKLLGIKVPEKEVRRILTDLGFKATKAGKNFSITVPTWRQKDITMEADLIEEVGRIYGYEKIEAVLPSMRGEPFSTSPKRELQKQYKNFLVSQGFSELCTFSFLGKELIEKSGLKTDDQTIEVLNPISNDVALMRQSLLPRTLQIIAENLRYQNTFRLFELSKIHLKKKEGVEEPLKLILATVNEEMRVVQGIAEALLRKMGLQKMELKNAEKALPHQHPGRLAEIHVQGEKIGCLYELHPVIEQKFDLKTKAVIAEIDFEKLMSMSGTKKKYREMDRFPAITLDVSLLIPRRKLALDYEKMIAGIDQNLIQNVKLIDEYEGEKIAEGKRSLTFSITYRLADRTLTEAEIKPVHDKILTRLKESGAEIR